MRCARSVVDYLAAGHRLLVRCRTSRDVVGSLERVVVGPKVEGDSPTSDVVVHDCPSSRDLG